MAEESSSDSTESDTEMDDQHEAALRAEVASIKSQLARQPGLYDLHTNLITTLRKLGELDELRLARENMNKIYPLSPELWIDWIKDERQISTSEDEKRQIECLFKRAVEDYDDASIWLEYCLFAIGNLQPGSAESVRSTEATFDLALSHHGLNVATGNAIWEMYRDFLNILLSQPNLDLAQSDALVKRIDKLYRRQLAVPLLGMESTMESYKEFLQNIEKPLCQGERETSDVPDDCLNEYQKASAQLELMTPFEDRIDPTTDQPQADRLSAWISYLDWTVSYPQKKSTDGSKSKPKETIEPFSPNHICCLFERAVTANCLETQIWLKYVDYLENKLSADRSRLVRVLARSVRNCPWSVDLWLRYALASECSVNDDLGAVGSNGVADHPSGSLERTAFASVDAVFEAALSVGLQEQPDLLRIWLAYCDYRLRRLLRTDSSTEEYISLLSDLRSIFDRANASLRKLFRNQADPDGTLVQYQSFIEAKYAKDAGAARALWTHFMQQPGHGAQGRLWLAYLQFERDWGDAKHFYRLCRMAINSVNLDADEEIFSRFLHLGAEAGLPVGQYVELEARVRSRIRDLEERARGTSTASYKERESSEAAATTKKRNTAPLDSETSVSKKPKLSTSSQKATTVSHPKSHGEHVVHDPSKDDRTIFVSNLDFSTTEDELRRTFETCGTLSSVRLVRDYCGRSKGYAYVEFQEPSAASEALNKDRQPVVSCETSATKTNTDDSGNFFRPMFVSRCDPSRTKSYGFHYSVGKVEPEKLFVRNLDKSVTTEALQKLFSEHGTVVSVRLATYRNGAPKGHAYVEFTDADQASRALVATDGLQLGTKKISVAISNPPVKGYSAPNIANDADNFAKPNPPSGHISHEQKARSHGRTQLAFLPRAIHRSSTSVTGVSEKTDSPAVSSEAMKSNEDFRKMFLS